MNRPIVASQKKTKEAPYEKEQATTDVSKTKGREALWTNAKELGGLPTTDRLKEARVENIELVSVDDATEIMGKDCLRPAKALVNVLI